MTRMSEWFVQYEEGLYAVFLDLKAAYDSVPRKGLVDCLKKLGVSVGVVDFVRGMYPRTEAVAKVGELVSGKFRVGTGLRQGCPLSPLLFNLYVADLAKVLIQGQDGGVVAGRR